MRVVSPLIFCIHPSELGGTTRAVSQSANLAAGVALLAVLIMWGTDDFQDARPECGDKEESVSHLSSELRLERNQVDSA